ncbi:glycosyl transferase family 2 [Arcicella aurantiaca]|uniref:Glycosyl transferase family 2 n=1 Tax=Arcicella aurantiaca TaxID=591202 RepID=A0A316DZJ7_9BACT|nr:glycosyltransferase [Arcicella aurantiaca]PWK22639.1 glycosyl transferase family 2 [Arcicella aurantiaca]
MKHTFVVLAYKESVYLEECILSLINQTEKSTIIISTATPNSFIDSIAQKYNLSLAIRKGVPTIANDWTFAYAQATTKYITLAHQDDIYLPNYTQNLLQKASKYDTSIAFCNYYEIRNKQIVKTNLLLFIKRILLLSLGINYVGKSKINKWLCLAFGSPICCPSVMYNKEKLGEWQFDNHFKVNLDWNSWLRVAKMQGAFVYTNKALMYHRIHTQSATTANLDDNFRHKEDIEIFTSLWGKTIGNIISKFYANSYKSNEL